MTAIIEDEQALRAAAVIKIQAHVRGHASRQQYHELQRLYQHQNHFHQLQHERHRRMGRNQRELEFLNQIPSEHLNHVLNLRNQHCARKIQLWWTNARHDDDDHDSDARQEKKKTQNLKLNEDQGDSADERGVGAPYLHLFHDWMEQSSEEEEEEEEVREEEPVFDDRDSDMVCVSSSTHELKQRHMEQSRVQMQQWHEHHRTLSHPHHHKSQLMNQYRHYRELRAKTFEIETHRRQRKKTKTRRSSWKSKALRSKIMDRLAKDLKTRDLDQINGSNYTSLGELSRAFPIPSRSRRVSSVQAHGEFVEAMMNNHEREGWWKVYMTKALVDIRDFHDHPTDQKLMAKYQSQKSFNSSSSSSAAAAADHHELVRESQRISKYWTTYALMNSMEDLFQNTREWNKVDHPRMSRATTHEREWKDIQAQARAQARDSDERRNPKADDDFIDHQEDSKDDFIDPAMTHPEVADKKERAARIIQQCLRRFVRRQELEAQQQQQQPESDEQDPRDVAQRQGKCEECGQAPAVLECHECIETDSEKLVFCPECWVSIHRTRRRQRHRAIPMTI